MKICIINNTYKPFRRGGADRMAEIMFEGLKGRGEAVFGIACRPYFSGGVKYEKNVYYLKSFFPSLSAWPVFLRFFWHAADMFNLANFFILLAILKKEKPDVVISHNLKGIGLLAPLAFNLARTKHVHVLHDIQLIHPSGLKMAGREKEIETLAAKIYTRLNVRLFAGVRAVISPSEWLIAEHKKRGFFKEARAAVIPNPVLLKEAGKSSAAGSIFKIFYIGEITESKGARFLVEAFLSARRRNVFFKNTSLVMAGKGEILPELEKFSSENLSFPGWLDSVAKDKAMLGYDLLVVPSLCYENYPTVICEAAASGLPVLASRLGGIPEIINRLGGYLYRAGDEDDFIKKLEWIIKNRQEAAAVGAGARKKAQMYSANFYLDRIYGIIKFN